MQQARGVESAGTRRLIVMRHAKSDWEAGAASDHARPLNERGRREAPRVAARLVELGWEPERVLSSDSARTRETWALMEPDLDPAYGVELRRDLYLAGLDELRDAVAEVPGDVSTVLVLGHNPGWEHAVAWLSGTDVPVKTANACLLRADAPTWSAALARRGGWELVEVIRPREL